MITASKGQQRGKNSRESRPFDAVIVFGVLSMPKGEEP
jgi:hypothetical protein